MVTQAKLARPESRPTSGPRPEVSRPGPVRDLIRIALVGCGAATRELHLPVLAGHEGVRLTALVDRDPDRARELAKAYKVDTVLSDTRELDRRVADAAVVCTPPFHHAPGSIELAERGLHVLVEKPMAVNYEAAQAMVRAAERAGIVLAVGLFRRLLPATRLVRGILDSGWLGQVLEFDVEEGEVYNWPTATLGNMRRDLSGGGVLIDFGSHTIDRLLFFFPGPAEVLEYRDNALGGIESDCVARLRLTCRLGPVEGRVELSRTRNLRNTFRFRCERGTVELRAGERYQVTITPANAAIADVLSDGPRDCRVEAAWGDQVEEESWYAAFRDQIDEWLESIRTGRPCRLAGSTALPSIKLIDECYTRRQPLVEPWVEEGLRQHTQPDEADRLLAVHPGNGPTHRVLLTGATGFIGGRMAEVLGLREGWDVRALVHSPSRASRLARLPVEMVVGDLHSEQDAARLMEGCDAVVHCAIGTTWGNRREIFDVTVEGTRRLTAAARSQDVQRFVHISTFAVHDLTASGVIDELTPVNPPRGNDYAESKAEAERVIARAVEDGLCAVTLRLANVYGPYSTIFTVRPIQHLAQNRLVLVGPAAEIPSSTIYVDSVVEAVVRVLEAPAEVVKGELFTISEGDALTWADFYGYFAQALGVKLRTISDEEFERRQTARRPSHWALTPFRGVKDVATSSELWALAKRVLKTEPLYSIGKYVLEQQPGLKRRACHWLKLDEPPVYHPTLAVPPVEDVEFDLTRPLVGNEKARRVLGFAPVPRPRAMELTLEWLRHARIVP
jgi:predicted dehydrogenase/nucleoside-diphosphate-sugar epimerase